MKKYWLVQTLPSYKASRYTNNLKLNNLAPLHVSISREEIISARASIRFDWLLQDSQSQTFSVYGLVNYHDTESTKLTSTVYNSAREHPRSCFLVYKGIGNPVLICPCSWNIRVKWDRLGSISVKQNVQVKSLFSCKPLILKFHLPVYHTVEVGYLGCKFYYMTRQGVC